jgi:hypothetical protein
MRTLDLRSTCTTPAHCWMWPSVRTTVSHTESRQLFTESRQLFTESRQLFTESCCVTFMSRRVHVGAGGSDRRRAKSGDTGSLPDHDPARHLARDSWHATWRTAGNNKRNGAIGVASWQRDGALRRLQVRREPDSLITFA